MRGTNETLLCDSFPSLLNLLDYGCFCWHYQDTIVWCARKVFLPADGTVVSANGVIHFDADPWLLLVFVVADVPDRPSPCMVSH